MFGRYGSQRMKDWQEIIKRYERDSIYLGEAAQLLVRNVNYDLPAVKKQIAKFDQLVEDAQKKIHDLTVSESTLNAQRVALCQKIGIEGTDLREEFLARIKELPKFNEEIAKSVAKIQDALKLYGESSGNGKCLPVVRFVAERGNTTVYEYVHGESPLAVEEPEIQLKLTIETKAAGDSNEVSVSGVGIWRHFFLMWFFSC